VTADELWGTAAVALAETVGTAASPAAALAEVQRGLAARLAEVPRPDPLVAAAVRRLMPWQRGEVGSLTDELGVSERQLRRRCRSETGHPPKPLHRMLRFQGFLALAQLAMAQGKPLTGERVARLAADAGYADQPHLTRECQRLTGESPRAFLGQVEDHCGCGHDHAASYAPLLRARPA
jgi:AraC-like DNA-binding protein